MVVGTVAQASIKARSMVRGAGAWIRVGMVASSVCCRSLADAAERRRQRNVAGRCGAGFHPDPFAVWCGVHGAASAGSVVPGRPAGPRCRLWRKGLPDGAIEHLGS